MAKMEATPHHLITSCKNIISPPTSLPLPLPYSITGALLIVQTHFESSDGMRCFVVSWGGHLTADQYCEREGSEGVEIL